MVLWVEPLALQTWIINVFAGDTKYFTAIAIIFITMMAGYFRMIGITLMLMMVIFFAMFKGYVDQSIYFIIISLGGLLVGWWIKRIVTR